MLFFLEVLGVRLNMYKRLLFCSQCYFPINKGQCVRYMIHLALFPAFLYIYIHVYFFEHFTSVYICTHFSGFNRLWHIRGLNPPSDKQLKVCSVWKS